MRRYALLLCTVLAVFTITTDAFALDGYADRRGLYLSLGANIGGGAHHITVGNTTIHNSRSVDGGLSAGIGAGIFRWLTLGGEFTWTGQAISTDEHHSYFGHQMNVLADVEFFVFHGLHLDVAAGLAISTTSGTGSTRPTSSDAHFGFGLKVGAGYEHFINGSIGLGGRFYYLTNFIGKNRYDSISGGVTLRWY